MWAPLILVAAAVIYVFIAVTVGRWLRCRRLAERERKDKWPQ